MKLDDMLKPFSRFCINIYIECSNLESNTLSRKSILTLNSTANNCSRIFKIHRLLINYEVT